MAYLDLSQAIHLPAPVAPIRVAAPLLGRAERNVLCLSRRDPRASLAPPRSIERRIRSLFGLAGPNPLADPRLEALRRFAVLSRHLGERLPVDEEVRLRVAGYTSAQMEEVRRVIGREPAAAPAHRRLAAALLVTVLAMQLVLYRFLAAYLDDGLMGLVGTAVATAVAVPPARLVGSFFRRTPVLQAA